MHKDGGAPEDTTCQEQATKEAYIAGLNKHDDVQTVVPQTTLTRSDRSSPGAFRVLTAAAAAAHSETTSSTDGCDSPLIVEDATIVATAVEDEPADDPRHRRGDCVTEVFKAVPLEEVATKPQRCPCTVLLVVVAALTVSVVSLGLAFTMRNHSSATSDQEAIATPPRGDLFASYDKITSHMAFLSIEIPSSCKLNGEPIRIQVTCGNDDTDSVLSVYPQLSLNIHRCEYNDQHNAATCTVMKDRLNFSYIVYSCGFHRVDDASSSVRLEENVATCSPASSEFDVYDAQDAIRTAVALGGLCWNDFGELEYKSVPTECHESDHTFLAVRGSTDSCHDVWMEDECTMPSGCVIGSYGIQDAEDAEPTCDAFDWNTSVFGPDRIVVSMEYVELIAMANRGFARLFDEDVGG